MQVTATPRAAAASPHLASGPDVPTAGSPGPVWAHCLLLVDEAGPAGDLATSLHGAGVRVTGLVTGPDALAEMTGTQTLLWPLPDTGSGGAEMSAAAKKGATTAAAAAKRGWSVVALASTPDSPSVRMAIMAGAMGYVSAPFTHARLLPTLELASARTAEIARLRSEVSEVSERLMTRKVVERAKGLLMAQQQLTEQAAFRLIQRTAMDHRRSMRDVAETITSQLAGAA